MLKTKGLIKRYGNKEVVRGISLEVAKGETFGLLGPNGAGKSTTIGMISGLITPTAGEVWIGGRSMQREPMAAKALLGVVPQDIALYETLSARENLLFWGAIYNLSGKELQKRVDEVLEFVALTDRQKDRVETFSGGMKRRVNIAASLLHRPQLLIMDEPTVGIDPQSRNKILETVKVLNQELGMTVIYTSHYMEEVQFLCERVAIVDHGQVIALGPLEEVRKSAGSESRIKVAVDGADEALVPLIRQVEGVKSALLEGGELVAVAQEPAEVIAPLMTVLKRAGRSVRGVQIEEPSLETVFLHLTGRALRD
jgi:ABC-2 type transport system ATP-binding protein